MTIYLKQSTASQEVPLGFFVDSTDGNTEETGLTIANTDIKIWKNGATTLANKNSGGGTHISNGVYYAVLDATDTNTLGPLVIFCHMSGALPVRLECVVLAANVFDSLIGGGDVLDVSVTQFNGSNVTQSGGRPEVNTTHIAGSAVSTSSAQIGVNVVNAAGTAWNSGAIGAATLATDTITAAKIAADAIGASELAADAATEIGTAVWATTTRILTAGTNIALAKGTGVTGFNDLDAAGVRSAVGLASANLDTQLSTIDTVVDSILVDTAEIGAAGAGLTAVPWNAAWDAEVQSECTDALNAYDPPTKSELDTAVANVSVGEIQASAVADLFNTDSLTDYASAVSGSLVKEIADNAGGSSLTAADIADAVWEEAIADHSGTAGSVAEQLAAAGAAGDPWATALPGSYTSGQAGKILGDNLNATISSRATQTSVDTVDDFLDTEIAAIKAVTDALPDSGALTSLATASAVATVDTVVDAIKAKTDSLTFTVAGQVDSNIQYVNDTEVAGDGQSGTEWRPA